MSSEVKLHNKEFEDMELTELYAERAARQWHKARIDRAKNALRRKLWWLEENKPILSKEEIKQKYENGEMTERQYRTSFANRKTAISYRMRVEDYLEYANRVIYAEEAVAAYIDDLIAEKLGEADAEATKKRKHEAKMRAEHKHYDPRKKTSKYNVNPLDPRREWATRTEDKPMPKLQGARARWKSGIKDDKRPMNIMKKMQPVITWDVEKLLQVTRDRGFFTELGVVGVIAETLGITMSGARKMLQSGRLTWSQCIIIGSIFEMTPKEFCDVFLSGYFKEVADGVYKAHVDDISALLDVPYMPRAVEKGADDDESRIYGNDGVGKGADDDNA